MSINVVFNVETVDELVAKLGELAPEFVAKDPAEVVKSAQDHNASVEVALAETNAKWSAKIKANKGDVEMVELLQGKLAQETERLEGQRVNVPTVEEVIAKQTEKATTHKNDWAKSVLETMGYIAKGSVKVRQAGGNSDGKFQDKWAVSLQLTKDIEAMAVNFRNLTDAQKAKYNASNSQDWLVRVNGTTNKVQISSPNNLIQAGRLFAGLSTTSPINNSVFNDGRKLTADEIAVL